MFPGAGRGSGCRGWCVLRFTSSTMASPALIRVEMANKLAPTEVQIWKRKWGKSEIAEC